LIAAGLIAAAALGIFSQDVGGGTAPTVTVTVFPQPLEFPAGQFAQAIVSVANDSDIAIRSVTLSVIGKGGSVNVTVSPIEPAEIPPHGSRAWTLSAERVNRPAETKVPLRVDYIWENDAGQGQKVTTPGVAMGSLDIKEPNPTVNSNLMAKLADVEIKTTLRSLTPDKPGLIVLLISNKSDLLLTVDATATSSSLVTLEGEKQPTRFIELTRINGDKPIAIERGGTGQIHFAVTATRRVNPGTHLIAFDIHIRTPVPFREQSIAAVHQFDVSVFGPEIAEPLQLPTFALAPGVVALLMFALIANAVRPAWKVPQWKAPEFWALAIVLSTLISLVIYPYFFAGQLAGMYGTLDVASMLVIGAVLGITGFVVIWAISDFGPGFLNTRRNTPRSPPRAEPQGGSQSH